MNRLVCNKTSPTSNRHLYKRNGHLVRTPIIKTYTLSPSAQQLYDVGNEYKQVLPTRDFFTTTGTGNYAIMAGHSMRKCYLGRETPSHDSSGWAQIWRNNNLYSASTDTGYVFYNGNYSPAMGSMGGAAFIRIPAYKFNIPSDISSSDYGWTVQEIKLNFVTHGIVLTSGNAAVKKTNSGQYPVFVMDANTNLLPSNSDWRGNRYLNIGVFSLGTFDTSQTPPRTLYGQCQQTATFPNVRTDSCNNAGSSNGFPLWISWPGGQVTYVDGHIINAPSNPYAFQITANSSFCEAATSLISNGSFLIPIIPNVSDSGSGGSTVTTNDYPYYYSPTSSSGGASNWWLCERHLLMSIEITFALV